MPSLCVYFDLYASAAAQLGRFARPKNGPTRTSAIPGKSSYFKTCVVKYGDILVAVEFERILPTTDIRSFN